MPNNRTSKNVVLRYTVPVHFLSVFVWHFYNANVFRSVPSKITWLDEFLYICKSSHPIFSLPNVASTTPVTSQNLMEGAVTHEGE